MDTWNMEISNEMAMPLTESEVETGIEEYVEEPDGMATDNEECPPPPVENESEEEMPASEDVSASPPDQEESEENLRAELHRLREELAETRRIHERMATELGEFHALFPDTDVASIPDGIWDQVRHGIPLAASYALYEKKCMMQQERAAAVNLRNAKKTPGAAGVNTPSEYFSPDDVRAMSQSEVRSNYQKILESMKTWNS